MDIESDIANGWLPQAFAAIDFETANRTPTSACAVAVVRVEGREIVARRARLARPPTTRFKFTAIHGVRWTDVRNKPAFGLVWTAMSSILKGVEFVAAHNAEFDQGVLEACCGHCRIPVPELPFVCTVKLARLCWHLHPAKLTNVCEFLGIELRHHDPLSDAEACARIVLAAMKEPTAVSQDPKEGP